MFGSIKKYGVWKTQGDQQKTKIKISLIFLSLFFTFIFRKTNSKNVYDFSSRSRLNLKLICKLSHYFLSLSLSQNNSNTPFFLFLQIVFNHGNSTTKSTIKWVARTNRFTTRTVIFSSLSQILKFVSVFPMQSHFALYKGFHWKPLNLLVIVVLFGDSFGYVYLKICVHVCLSDDVQLKLSVMGFILMLLILLILILSFVFKFSV